MKGRKKKSKVKDYSYSSDKCWDSYMDISKDDKCPHISGERTPKIIIPYRVWQKILSLTHELNTEWLGYLGGSRLQTGEWKVIDIIVPKQEVSSTTCKATTSLPSAGVVHSHVHMGCFFSGTDDSYLNENHDFSIVVNKDEETKAVVRLKLPCGALTIVEADVDIEYPAVRDAVQFLEEAKKNIIEEEPWTYNKPKKSWKSLADDNDNDDNIVDNMGVPDYIPQKKDKSKLDPWDYGDSYGDLAG